MGKKKIRKGEHVEWDTPRGKTEGDVQEKVTSRTRIKKHTVAASEQDPQYKVKSSKTGKEAIHHPEELRRKNQGGGGGKKRK
ncbi:DUF2945 domain-containing protein [Chitinispirillales bacterium ANBcel5]|uniref:DUF2945 domain-containing protein n=1 Tax=Cellulosispirillum alkaliphilum TaxID=3039283 RepID=UPI002A55A13F|nr:DUF2945 domain-containing protein [Chitinispirillales bacterium ANBcel5]